MSFIPESTLVQTYNSTENTAEFNIVLSKPVVLNQYDTFALQQGFLKQVVGNGIFTIAEDIELIIQCGFYETRDASYGPTTSSPGTQDPRDTTYEYFILSQFTENFQDYGTGNWAIRKTYYRYQNFTLPAGTYTGTALASYISQQLQVLNVLRTYPIDTSNQLCTVINDIGVGVDQFYGFSSLYPTNPVSGYFYNRVTPPPGDPSPSCHIVGSTNLSLIYDAENSRFAFDMLHIPAEDTHGNIVINMRLSDNDGIVTQTTISGVFLNQLKPESFWQDVLGFSIPDITFDPDKGDPPERFFNAITQQFCPLGNLASSGSPYKTPEFTGTVIQFASDDTVRINGQYLPSINFFNGFYLLKVNFGLARDSLVSDVNKGNIMAVCSCQYTSNQGIVTVFGSDSAILYQHRDSNPLTITSINASLLDSNGYESPANISNGSFLFFVVTNNFMINELPLKKIEKKKKNEKKEKKPPKNGD